MITLILLTIGMHIRLNRPLKVGHYNIKYNLKETLCEKYIKANQDNNSKIEKAMAANDNKNDDEKDFLKKNR